MLCTIAMNRYGALEIEPVNQETASSLRDAYAQVHGRALSDNEALVYLQVESDVEAILDSISKAAARDLRSGYSVNARVDDDLIHAALGLS